MLCICMSNTYIYIQICTDRLFIYACICLYVERDMQLHTGAYALIWQFIFAPIRLYLPVFSCICLPVFACICLYGLQRQRQRGHCAAAALQLWHVRRAVAKCSPRGPSIRRQIAKLILVTAVAATGAFLVHSVGPPPPPPVASAARRCRSAESAVTGPQLPVLTLLPARSTVSEWLRLQALRTGPATVTGFCCSPA
jgi:hypothetical protein